MTTRTTTQKKEIKRRNKKQERKKKKRKSGYQIYLGLYWGGGVEKGRVRAKQISFF